MLKNRVGTKRQYLNESYDDELDELNFEESRRRSGIKACEMMDIENCEMNYFKEKLPKKHDHALFNSECVTSSLTTITNLSWKAIQKS